MANVFISLKRDPQALNFTFYRVELWHQHDSTKKFTVWGVGILCGNKSFPSRNETLYDDDAKRQHSQLWTWSKKPSFAAGLFCNNNYMPRQGRAWLSAWMSWKKYNPFVWKKSIKLDVNISGRNNSQKTYLTFFITDLEQKIRLVGSVSATVCHTH